MDEMHFIWSTILCLRTKTSPFMIISTLSSPFPSLMLQHTQKSS